MVLAAQLAALGSTRKAATLLPGATSGEPLTYREKVSLNFPEACAVSGRKERARLCASARLLSGVLASGIPCPRAQMSSRSALYVSGYLCGPALNL